MAASSRVRLPNDNLTALNNLVRRSRTIGRPACGSPSRADVAPRMWCSSPSLLS